MIEVIPLKYGSVFKRVFSQPAVFQQFAQDILGIQFQVQQIHTEYEYPEPVGFVRSRYDLFAEDPEQRIVVEIQHVKEEDFFDRFLYYHLISLVEQVRGYQAYGFERTVYTIVVLTSVPQDSSIDFSCAVSDFSPVDEFERRHPIYPHRLIFLVPRLVNDKTPPAMRRWLDFIADSLDGKVEETQYQQDNLFQQMLEAIKRQTISPAELAEIKDESAWEMAKARFAREGREEGREQGRAEGRAEGREEGIELGLEKGRTEGQAAIVLTMRKHGLSIEQIADMTGIDPEQVRQISEGNNPDD